MFFPTYLLSNNSNGQGKFSTLEASALKSVGGLEIGKD